MRWSGAAGPNGRMNFASYRFECPTECSGPPHLLTPVGFGRFGGGVSGLLKGTALGRPPCLSTPDNAVSLWPDDGPALFAQLDQRDDAGGHPLGVGDDRDLLVLALGHAVDRVLAG